MSWVAVVGAVFFIILFIAGAIEEIVRNRNRRFPNWFTPILLTVLAVGGIFLLIDYVK